MSRSAQVEPAAFWIWLLRGALLFHPRKQRSEYGREIEAVFRSRVIDARTGLGQVRILVFQLKEIKGLMRTGLLARWEDRTGRSGSAHGPRQHPKRDRNGIMTGFVADLRLALRGIRKAPGFTLSAVTILALGIGANITAFSALKVAVLTPPPFPESARMVSVDLTRSGNDGERASRWAYPYLQKLADWPDRLIDPVAGYRQRVATLTGFGPASELPIEVVSPGYFKVVGLPMTLGRGFVAEEADPTGPYRVVVVSYAFWQAGLAETPQPWDESCS